MSSPSHAPTSDVGGEATHGDTGAPAKPVDSPSYPSATTEEHRDAPTNPSSNSPKHPAGVSHTSEQERPAPEEEAKPASHDQPQNPETVTVFPTYDDMPPHQISSVHASQENSQSSVPGRDDSVQPAGPAKRDSRRGSATDGQNPLRTVTSVRTSRDNSHSSVPGRDDSKQPTPTKQESTVKRRHSTVYLEDADQGTTPDDGVVIEGGNRDTAGRLIDEKAWNECPKCGVSQTKEEPFHVIHHLDPAYAKLTKINCCMCKRTTPASRWTVVRVCTHCNAMQCSACLDLFTDGAQAWGGGEDAKRSSTLWRRIYIVAGAIMVFIFVSGVALAFASSFLVSQTIFNKQLVWYGSCDVPGYSACSSGINAYTALRTAEGINNPDKRVDAELSNQLTWMSYVGMTDFLLEQTTKTQINPILYDTFGLPSSTTLLPFISDVYTNEVVYKDATGKVHDGLFGLYNISFTVITATYLYDMANFVLSRLNSTTTYTAGGFSTFAAGVIDPNNAPPLVNLSTVIGVYGPTSTWNSSVRLWVGTTAPWSVMTFRGPHAVLHTRMNVTMPEGKCLDIDPIHKDFTPANRFGFVRATSCYIYGQEFDVVPPWLFLVSSAGKNVIMIFVIQRFLSWVMGKVKKASQGAAFVAKRAGILAWSRNLPAPRIIQRTEMFHKRDVYTKNSLKLEKDELARQAELAAAREKEKELYGERPGSPSRADFGHADGTENTDEGLDLDENGEPRSELEEEVIITVATDYPNEDFVMMDIYSNLIPLPQLRAEDFCRSKYFELKRADPTWVREWLVESYVPSTVFGQMQLCTLAGAEERRDFPLTKSEMCRIIAALWTSHAKWGEKKEYGMCTDLSDYRGTREKLIEMSPRLFKQLREQPSFPPIETILKEAQVPHEFIGELHDVIAKDLWVMCHASYDYGTTLNTVFSKQTVLLSAIIYSIAESGEALKTAGFRALADTVQVALPSRTKALAGEQGVHHKDNNVSRREYEKLLQMRDNLIAALNKCSTRRKNIHWDDGEAQPASKDVAFGGPDNENWRFCDFCAYFHTVFNGMPQARGFLSAKIQTAHHVVNSAYPNNILVTAGFMSSFCIMVNALVAAHQTPLRATRTIMLSFLHRWVNSGVLASNLSYAAQIVETPRWYGVDWDDYVLPRSHSLYLGITAVALIAAAPLFLAGLAPSLFTLVLVMVFLSSTGGVVTAASRVIARLFDTKGTGTATALLYVAGESVLASFAFGLLIQTPNNVGYALILDLFEFQGIPTDPNYWIADAVGDEYLGRRLSCTLEHMTLDVTSLVGMLSYVVLP